MTGELSFKACKEENVRIYEGVSNLEIKDK